MDSENAGICNVA